MAEAKAPKAEVVATAAATVLTEMRKRAVACRCQLLTGSYAHASRSCPCLSPEQCVLSADEREQLYNDHLVRNAREQNQREFNLTELREALDHNEHRFFAKGNISAEEYFAEQDRLEYLLEEGLD
jgi:hypothetical protein